jgi:hypothetical protein
MMFPLCTSVTERPPVPQGVLDGGAHQALRPLARHGLMPKPLDSGKRTFLKRSPKFSASSWLKRAASAGAFLELDAGVDVLGVLAVDHHVHVAGALDGRGDALEPAHGPHAGVQVQHLAQRHVQRADAAAHRRGQRPLDPH